MSAQRAEVKVLSTTAMKTVLDRIAPDFESRHGYRLAMSFGPSGRMAKLAADGEMHDVAIVTGGSVDELIGTGRAVPGSRSDVARSLIGLAVARGASRPDISSTDGFKRALLSARAIAMSNPAGGAQSGAHLAKVFEKLGIAQALESKLLFGPGGPAGLVGNFLLRGEADIGLQQMPELMAVPGIDIAGPIPEEVQLVTLFSACVSAATANPDGARAWISHLATAEAADAIKASGMQPAW